MQQGMPNCPKCNGEMREHKTAMSVVEGLMKYKKLKAYVCRQCGFVELYV